MEALLSAGMKSGSACLVTLLVLLAAPLLRAQTGENVLLVVNRKDALSRQIADY